MNQTEEAIKLVIDASPSLAVTFYLVISWEYFENNTMIVSDDFYSELCRAILNPVNKEMRNNSLFELCKTGLMAGTCLLESTDYPKNIQGVAKLLNNRVNKCMVENVL